MRVLLDTTPLLNQNRARGVGRYTQELLQALRQLTDTDEPLIVQATHEVGIILDPSQDFDLIHYPYFDLFFSTLPKPSRLPVVVTVHDVIPLLFPQHYPPGLKGKWRFWQQKRHLQQATAVITDSENSKRDINQYLDIPAARIYVTPLAANPALQPPTEYAQQKAKQALNLPSQYVLYIGDINYNKNLPTLLLALTQLPAEIHLGVVSQTFNDTTIPEGQMLAELIHKNDLAERVHVWSIPPEDTNTLAAVIAAAKCLVQPSLYEGFGLPVLEAMQVGTVVVAANTSSLPEVAGEAALLVEPTIVGLTNGLQEAVSWRGEEREKRIKSGQQQAARFSWEQTARLTYQVYQEAQRLAGRGK